MLMRRKGLLLCAGVLLALVSACAGVDYWRLAHNTLHQVQCRQTEPRGACDRDFGEDYRAWRQRYDAHRQPGKIASTRTDWPGDYDPDGLPDLACRQTDC